MRQTGRRYPVCPECGLSRLPDGSRRSRAAWRQAELKKRVLGSNDPRWNFSSVVWVAADNLIHVLGTQFYL